MVMPNEVPVPIDAPLRAQRGGLRERAQTVLHSRQSGLAFIQMLIGRRRAQSADVLVSTTAPQPTLSSAATEAALVQRITGPGSGPYSGTPFLMVPHPTDDAVQPRAADEPCDAARHDHGIIDHSRHVSSLGRR
jgi:hypothetical protein